MPRHEYYNAGSEKFVPVDRVPALLTLLEPEMLEESLEVPLTISMRGTAHLFKKINSRGHPNPSL